ncbi:MAG TPA: ISAs1 family transposase [Dongiaceae bacterium]|jgi:predicted transposase YbfD/YdcC|nr:ISAs1 family transposase [Dongiaceae bacterium]
MQKFRRIFRKLPDPRADNARHDLTEILVIALAAVLCGAESCADMADFGEAKEGLLRQFLRLEHGIPSHDTFSRIFRILDPLAFEAAFRKFMAAFAKKIKGVVSIDGKALKGAFERGRKTTPLHLVNVWAADARLAIGQYVAPNRNEVAGALEALKLVSLEGCVVTADALHCHAAMAQGILDRGAAYVLALKENQSALFADAVALLQPVAHQVADILGPGHGRAEERRASVVKAPALAKKHDFPGIKAIGRVELRRRVGNTADPLVVRYFLLSKVFSPKRLLAISRKHWGIENALHWVLDVAFDEDRARNRKDHGPENIAILRKLALNLLRSNPDNASIRRKIKRAGWDDTFLLALLSQMR